MDDFELDELNERIYRAWGWEKLPWPASPRWQKPMPDGTMAMYAELDYSRNIMDAWNLVENMRNAGLLVILKGWPPDHVNKFDGVARRWVCEMICKDTEPHYFTEAETAPLAICKTWLAWKEGKHED